ncbi:MAG: Tfp pilus assembly protein PilF [Streptosporangiaceae bacterium]|jgi:hypothetical protein|nr:Tfp pilus assembly protein PilF [Streptosporangiaceae bacterium]
MAAPRRTAAANASANNGPGPSWTHLDSAAVGEQVSRQVWTARSLGRLEEAEADNRAVLKVRERVLGSQHPDTLSTRSNLATVLYDLGRPEDAEE